MAVSSAKLSAKRSAKFSKLASAAVVFDKSVNSNNHELASSIRNEWVIQVEGIVKKELRVPKIQIFQQDI